MTAVIIQHGPSPLYHPQSWFLNQSQAIVQQQQQHQTGYPYFYKK
jgi:hypothetical protein